MPSLRRLCLVVPCFNEARRLQTTRLREWIAKSLDARLVFVDDGSRDTTAELLEQLRRGSEDRISILTLRPNRGKAEAVRSGILHALDQFEPAIVGFWDADLATPLDAVNSLISTLNARPDIEMIFGARVQLLGRHVQRNPFRHYLGRIFATAVSSTLRLPIYDTQCGAKLFRVEPHTRSIFAEPFLSKWIFDVEIIARYLQLYGHDTKRLARLIYEYPLETWVDMAGSKVRPSDFFTAPWEVVRIHQRYLAGRQKPG